MIGTSTFPAEQIVEAQWCSEKNNREKFRTEQPPYSIFARRIEADILPTCQRYDMGVVVWSPLSQGWLTGKWRHGQKPNDTQRQHLQPHLYEMDRLDNRRKLDLIDQLDDIAKAADTTIMHMAIAFVCSHPAVTAAIIGPRTMAQLDGLLEGAEVELNDNILDAIDELIPPGTNVSHDDDGYVAPEIEDKALRRRQRKTRTHEAARETLDNIEAYREQQGKK